LRLRATFFIRFLIVINLCAIFTLLIMPKSVYAAGVSVLIHLFSAITLFWFMVKVVWPVRGGLNKLVAVVEKHSSDEEPVIIAQPELDMGSYEGIVMQTTDLLERQYQKLISHSRQLENFSRVLERQNLKVNESRQRYRTALDALENGLYLIDDNFIIRTVNQAEAAFCGATPKEIVGKYCYQVFRQRKSPCQDCMPRECMADGKARSLMRAEKRRAGRAVVNVFCYPVFHEGESKSREVVVYIQDTSQLAVMEDQVIRAEKMASVGQMAAGIAHDLNNYLAGIYGVVQLLQMRFATAGEDRGNDIKLLGRLRDQVEALNLLAGNLMIFSYPERKEMFPLSLNQVIEDALVFSRYELERDQVVLTSDFAEGLPSVQMEKGQIQQVLLNLMLNAAQAIRELKASLKDELEGRIVVATGLEKEGCVFFSVADNGAGIDPECREHLFDPFFSTKEVKAERGATGLGLFTARTIVDQHQGTIGFSSEPDNGSCFKVVLPIRQGAEPCI
jgi:PAS domain S-box-containing protein